MPNKSQPAPTNSAKPSAPPQPPPRPIGRVVKGDDGGDLKKFEK